MNIDYQIYLDEEQLKRKKSGKNIYYVVLEINFFNYESDESSSDETSKKTSNKSNEDGDLNVFESTIVLKMYNHKLEKFENSDKPIKKDFEEFLSNIKKGKKAVLDEEYIVHKSHYISCLKYHKDRLIMLLLSPIHEFQTVIDIKENKDNVIKIFEDFIKSSDNFF